MPLSRPDPDELLAGAPGESDRRRCPPRGRPRAAGHDRPGELELAPDAGALLASKLRAGGLSARGLHKVTRVARTVAALAGADDRVLRPRLRSAVAAGRPRRGGGMSTGDASGPPSGGVCRRAGIPAVDGARPSARAVGGGAARDRMGAGDARGRCVRARRRTAPGNGTPRSAFGCSWPGSRRTLQRLEDDPQAPALLFCLGDPAVLGDAPTVALVGTRAPTRYGIGVAAQFGADLSAAGVSVVSGLALGIDGAAHEGACGAGAPPVGVVAGGLDHPYPRRHERLWERVASSGVIVSESPAGVPTEKWRFPVRNRLLAALSDVVVVVESRHHGGSRHTVDAAIDRGVPVGAVPGSIRSATSEGTNALLADGAFPVCSSGDILVALALTGASVAVPRQAAGRGSPPPPPDPPQGLDRRVYDTLTPDPSSLDELVRVTGIDLAELCGSLERLAQAGLARDAGGWWERA